MKLGTSKKDDDVWDAAEKQIKPDFVLLDDLEARVYAFKIMESRSDRNK
jgi:hypothetical protein